MTVMTDLDRGGPKNLRIRIYNTAAKHYDFEPAIALKYVIISISVAQPLQDKMVLRQNVASHNVYVT